MLERITAANIRPARNISCSEIQKARTVERFERDRKAAVSIFVDALCAFPAKLAKLRTVDSLRERRVVKEARF